MKTGVFVTVCIVYAYLCELVDINIKNDIIRFRGVSRAGDVEIF